MTKKYSQEEKFCKKIFRRENGLNDFFSTCLFENHITECVCNYTICEPEPICGIYEELLVTDSENICCEEYKCVCVNETILEDLCPSSDTVVCPVGTVLTNVTKD